MVKNAGSLTGRLAEEEHNMMTIAVTGHRPNKLWGYDLSHPKYERLQAMFEENLLKLGCTDAWTGMALGVDTVFAHAVLALKEKGHPIRLHCAIPCQGHSSRWFPESVREYQRILGLADEVKLVTDAPYSPQAMMDRNKYMVDRADIVLAVWDGSRGGTGNCVNYARRTDKDLMIISPSGIEA